MGGRFTQSFGLVLHELAESLQRVPPDHVEKLLGAIRSSRNILVIGAGRMGIILSMFSLRLNHLGFTSHVVGSTSCPPIGPGDLLLVASSSGETPTVREIVRKAREYEAGIAVVTAQPTSTIGRMASVVVHVQAPASIVASEQGALLSKQPMKTLFEQTLFILLEAMVLELMRETDQTASDLARRHGNLE